MLALTHLPQDVVLRSLKSLEIRGLDKIEHILAYGTIAYLFALSLKKPSALLLCFLWLGISTMGVADELTQSFVGRTASLADFMADVIGITLAFSFFFLVKRRVPSDHVEKCDVDTVERPNGLAVGQCDSGTAP